MRSIFGLAAAGMMILAASMPVRGAKSSANDLAAKKITGTWALNKGLSPAFDTIGRGRGGRGGGLFQQGSAVVPQPRYPQGVKANPVNTEPTDATLADLTPTERAEVIALRQIGHALSTIRIEATPLHVMFSDERGDSECDINGKTEKVRMFGAVLGVKCRWDKTALRQEFSTTRTKLTRTWMVDDREMLVMKAKVEGLDQNSSEATAVFDRVR